MKSKKESYFESELARRLLEEKTKGTDMKQITLRISSTSAKRLKVLAKRFSGSEAIYLRHLVETAVDILASVDSSKQPTEKMVASPDVARLDQIEVRLRKLEQLLMAQRGQKTLKVKDASSPALGYVKMDLGSALLCENMSNYKNLDVFEDVLRGLEGGDTLANAEPFRMGGATSPESFGDYVASATPGNGLEEVYENGEQADGEVARNSESESCVEGAENEIFRKETASGVIIRRRPSKEDSLGSAGQPVRCEGNAIDPCGSDSKADDGVPSEQLPKSNRSGNANGMGRRGLGPICSKKQGVGRGRRSQLSAFLRTKKK